MNESQLGYLLNTIKDDQFVPSLNGKTAYSGWIPGIIYSILYFCTDQLGKKNLREKNKLKLLYLMQEAFEISIQKLNEAKNAFEISCQSTIFEQEQEKTLLSWKLHILRFVKTPPAAFNEAWEGQQELFDSVKAACDLLHLRHCQLQPLPYNALCNLLEDKELNEKEEGEMAAWCAELNQSKLESLISPKRQLGVHRLHRGLAAFIQLRLPESTPEEKVKKLATLELKLGMTKFKETYLDIFKTSDPKLEKWRLEVEESKIIQTGIEIGEKLEVEKKEIDRHHVYTRKDHPDQIIVISRHCAFVGMEEAEIENYGTNNEKYLTCHYIDPKGRFKIMHKGDLSLSNVKWASQRDPIVEEDLQWLNPLCEELAPLINGEEQYSQMNPSYFIFHEGRCKHYAYLNTKTFNYLEVEAFLWKISQTNFYIYRHLIKTLQLDKKEDALFLKKIALNHLLDKELDFQDKEKPLCEAAERLIDEIDKKLHSVIKKKKEENPQTDIRIIQTSVKKAMRQWISKIPFGGRI